MALSAKLQFGNNDIERYDKEYLVVNVRCHFAREYDSVHPVSTARCESITLTIVAPDKEDMGLFEWYLYFHIQTGRIIFELQDGKGGNEVSYTKAILFENAQCMSLKEVYDIKHRNRRLLQLSFEADVITINNEEFKHL